MYIYTYIQVGREGEYYSLSLFLIHTNSLSVSLTHTCYIYRWGEGANMHRFSGIRGSGLTSMCRRCGRRKQRVSGCSRAATKIHS